MSGVTAQTLLEYDGAEIGYGSEAVVRGVAFDVTAGEIVGLVGPNGAGKSTLLKAVTGEATLHAGEVRVHGVSSARLGARERATLVGVVPQQVGVAFSLPAREFVEMGRHPHLPRFGRPGPADREAVDWAMRITDTERLAGRPVDALSGGDLQRLALAQALATRPRLLLLDEATAHLDLNHRLQVLDLVRELADGGVAVLAVFHDLDLAARYSDRIALVHDRRVERPGAPEQVLTAESVRTVFRVRTVVATDPVTGSVSVTPVVRDEAIEPVGRGSVLVIGGAGSAAPLMRRLVLGGWSVAAGALNAGDADAVVAEALGVDYAGIPPFAPMDSAAAIRVAQLSETVDAVVVCPVPFGHGNIDNLLIAVRAGKPIVLVGDIDGRDFAGGAARSYWIEAVGAGAIVVEDIAHVEGALEGLVTPPEHRPDR